ncbi:MAG: hypothetical protein KJ000_02535 [Pirellulaceae bacterium]|nr:hypothetical protein [Pirellulaceae bacterium]
MLAGCWSFLIPASVRGAFVGKASYPLLPPSASDSKDADATPEPQAACCPHCGQAALYTVRRTHRPTVPELIARTYGPQPFDTS